MPIRFYCPFCDQLLGISRRKAGAVVECPRCHGKVGVPAEGEAVPPALPPLSPVTARASTARPDVVLTGNQVAALVLVLVLLLGLSFTAGLLIGALT